MQVVAQTKIKVYLNQDNPIFTLFVDNFQMNFIFRIFFIGY